MCLWGLGLNSSLVGNLHATAQLHQVSVPTPTGAGPLTIVGPCSHVLPGVTSGKFLAHRVSGDYRYLGGPVTPSAGLTGLRP